MNTEKQNIIEALLFVEARPLTISELVRMTSFSKEEVVESLKTLKQSLEGRGIELLENQEEVALVTSATVSPILEKLKKDELSRELTKAALEVLSLVIYKNGATRAEIDYIRGVQSGFTLRNLQVRGLIEKQTHKTDSRKILYVPSVDTLRYMGITETGNMPEFEKWNKLLNNIKDEESIETESVVTEELP